MNKYLVAGLVVAVVMVAMDVLWLGFVAKALYQYGIGHLMAEHPKVLAAVAFYGVYSVGLVVFTVAPSAGVPGWYSTALKAGLFGFVAYATYDLSNLATLQGWPLWLSLVDMAWGSAVSALAATAGKLAMDRF
ncbi:MAG: DUF2177 family protein [Rhodoferax sp.]|uniref:DUF2177 family protein n=1 Tax=Rhodoferax sp. TaxID=50421 RepID=UPI003266290A